MLNQEPCNAARGNIISPVRHTQKKSLRRLTGSLFDTELSPRWRHSPPTSWRRSEARPTSVKTHFM